ncbi:MAG: DUF4838 domain-containing protein [Bryobacteraceae bacterium]
MFGLSTRLRALPLVALSLFMLSGDTEAAVRIVLSTMPAAPERFAAEELVKYLVAMGNPKPSVVLAPEEGDIYIGTLPGSLAAVRAQTMCGRLTGKDPDSFVLRSIGKRLVIYGNSPRANLFGTYYYLESLGARWYFPGAENEVVPQAAVKLETYDVTEIPSFRKRGICVFATTPGLAEQIDFAAKNRLNTIALHTEPSAPPFADAGYDVAVKAIGPRGLTIDIERHFFSKSFCPDDTATLEREKTNFRKYLSTLPSSMNEFFLWPADTALQTRCSVQDKDYSVSDIVLWFSNEIARTLREIRLQGRFPFLAYWSTTQPPKHVRPAPGVFLEWAPMWQSFAHAIDDASSATNREHRQNLERFLEIFKPEEAQVLGYWLDDTFFLWKNYAYNRLPYCPTALKGDLAYYHRLGIPAITSFGVMLGSDYFSTHASPTIFLYPRLLWNVKAEPREVMNEFCRSYFGSADACKIFDLLAEADQMVYVEQHKVRRELVNAPRYVQIVSRAVDLSLKLVAAQSAPTLRARAVRLVQEATTRFSQGRPQHNVGK